MANHQAGFLQQRAVWAPSQCQMLLRCTTASYHAGDFRKEKTKMEDEFGLAGKRGGLAKARSAVTPAASAAIRPARAGALRARNRTAGWLSRPAALDYDRHTTKARRRAGLCVETLNRRQPVADAIS